MHANPTKPTLKAPGTERLKLKYEELLSNFGIKFDLRRYIKDVMMSSGVVGVAKKVTRGKWYHIVLAVSSGSGALYLVGRCRLTVCNPC